MTKTDNQSLVAKPHSKTGIASVIISVLTFGVGIFWYLLNYFFFESIFGKTRVDSVARFTIISFTFAAIALIPHILGLILGIIGCRSKDTKSVFPILGTVFNVILILTDILLITLLIFVFILATAPVH
jgi:hypothetical protein